MKDFDEKWVVITGASSGIGESLARQFAFEGANLILVARRKERLEVLAVALQDTYHVAVEVFAADLSKPEACEDLVQFSKPFGVQGLVNNAGIGAYGPLLDFSWEQYEQLMALNMTRLTQLTHGFVRLFTSGSKEAFVLNVASVAAFQPIAKFSVYAAGKRYVWDLTQALRQEFKRTNLSFHCLLPGSTRTEFFDPDRIHRKVQNQMMSADAVAAIAVKGVKRNKATIVPGLSNRLVGFFAKILPRSWMVYLADKTMSTSIE